MPITHKWDGTILTITSDSGSSSCDLKGEKGDDGARGAQGAPGGTCYNVSQAAYNLLDNSDFRNPINQRGTTSTKINAEHIIDRWRVDSMASQATVSINANGITLEPTADRYCSIYQQLERYAEMKGKIYTIAICVNDIWDCKTVTIGQHAVAEIFNNGIEFYSIDNVHVLLRNREGKNPITIQRVALYEGEYTADTLPAYQPKGYAAELAECQRYYIHNVGRYTPVCITSATLARATITIPTKMRTLPTVNIINADNIAATVDGSGVIISIKGITAAALVDNGIALDITIDWAGFRQFQMGMAFMTSFSLSADL